MRKTLLLGTLLISLNSFAGTDNSNPSMWNTLKDKMNTTNPPPSVSIIYGGQDISRQRVATADESVWKGRPIMNG